MCTQPTDLRCPIKGHNHDLNHYKDIVQKGTGTHAVLYECPTGRYRFFVIDGQRVSRDRMYVRPRFGWHEYNHG